MGKQKKTENESPLSWQYDEFNQVSKDYGKFAVVGIYDVSHAGFRDVEAESNRVLDILTIKNNNVLVDFGSGQLPSQYKRRRAGGNSIAVGIVPVVV